MKEITKKMLERKVLEDEKKLQRIRQNEKEERERCYGLKFKLVGIFNRLDLIPDFVIPIFYCVQDMAQEIPEKTYYFQVGDDKTNTLNNFSKLRDYDENYIRFVQLLEKENGYSNVLFDICSKPLYAFQSSKEEIFFGEYEEMREFLKKYQTEEFCLPLINCKDGNNGIMYYGRKADFTVQEKK